MLKKPLILFLFFLVCLTLDAQVKNIFSKTSDVVKYPESIIDPDYGIRIYEKFNPLMGGDSVRNCKGYACQGWVDDLYESGTLIHKGFYNEGQLNIYKNFYPTGALEREFKNLSINKCELTTYYPNGQVRTKGTYVDGGNPLKYEEYYANGQLEYIEENHKSMQYYIMTESYYENGKPESILKLVDPKKLVFTKVEYWDNGNVREEGKLFFNKGQQDYYKVDKWSFYDEVGRITHEIFYENGKSIKTKNY
jgi:antitoxin component YwqK of YwqJK toxin-antitoxin module